MRKSWLVLQIKYISQQNAVRNSKETKISMIKTLHLRKYLVKPRRP